MQKINKIKLLRCVKKNKPYKIDKILAKLLYNEKICDIIILGVEGFHTKKG